MEIQTDAGPGGGAPLEVAILFADLVSSSEFASVMSLGRYAEYVASFEETCERQCRHFFEVFHQGDYARGMDYQVSLLGDELVVFLHTGNHADDVYQLICLSIALKCAWLASRSNAERLDQGMPAIELAVGIHAGLVWATPGVGGAGPKLRGFSINVAKRVETASRDGQHFRIYISGSAFKRVNRKIRHLLIGPKQMVHMKGIVLPVSVHELLDSFVDLTNRLHPEALGRFREMARRAIASNSFDVWIHSCYQVVEGAHCFNVVDGVRKNWVSDECLDLCREMLNLQSDNAVALFYAAEALIDRGEYASAMLYLEDLTRSWPTYTDGWLSLSRAAGLRGDRATATRAALQARRHGATADDLPPDP
jgi:class 3 adenylate cyclase